MPGRFERLGNFSLAQAGRSQKAVSLREAAGLRLCGQGDRLPHVGFSLCKLAQTQPGAGQIAQIDDLAGAITDLANDSQSFLIQLRSRLVITAKAGALAHVAPHRGGIAPVIKFLAQGQALPEVAVGLQIVAQLQVGDTVELIAGRHPAPVIELTAELERFLAQGQHRRRVAQAVTSPTPQVQCPDELAVASFARAARQQFRPFGRLDRGAIFAAALMQEGQAVKRPRLGHHVAGRFRQGTRVDPGFLRLVEARLGSQGFAQSFIPPQSFGLDVAGRRGLGR